VKDLSFALPSGFDMANIRQEITVPDKLEAPVLSGDVVGQLSCYAGDVLLGASPLVAAETMLTPAAETQPVMQIKNAANAAHPDGDVMNPTEQSTVENITPAEPLNTTLTDGINPNQPAAEYDLTSNYYLTLVAPLVITLTALVVSLTKFIRRRRHGKYLQMPGYSRISGNIYKYK
jgi:hypothetical protein